MTAPPHQPQPLITGKQRGNELVITLFTLLYFTRSGLQSIGYCYMGIVKREREQRKKTRLRNRSETKMNRTPIIIAVVIIAIIIMCCCSLFALFWTIGSWQRSQEPYAYDIRISELSPGRSGSLSGASSCGILSSWPCCQADRAAILHSSDRSLATAHTRSLRASVSERGNPSYPLVDAAWSTAALR
jgi:hypothetical protein